MKRAGGMSYTKTVSSTEWTDIVEVQVAENVDRIVIAVYNGFTGVELGNLDVRVFGQIVKDGEFLQIKFLMGNDGVSYLGDTTVPKGTGMGGALGDFGYEAVRIACRRSDSVDIPVIFEVKFLAQEVGE
jgi:hypothetical protein